MENLLGRGDLEVNQWEPTLQRAIAFYNGGVVKILLNHSKNFVNLRSSTGSTAFHWAALEGDVELAKLLLDAGAKPNLAKNDGSTTLLIAIKNNRITIVQVLLDFNMKLNNFDKFGLTLAHDRALYNR